MSIATNLRASLSLRAAQRPGHRFKCMSANGVWNFPDPQVRTGVCRRQPMFYLPGVNIESPAVQSAAKACGGGPKGL